MHISMYDTSLRLIIVSTLMLTGRKRRTPNVIGLLKLRYKVSQATQRRRTRHISAARWNKFNRNTL